jgi:hypothetical protein
MLEFFMQVYDSRLAQKYIFIHGHERSWHHTRPVFEQIHELVSSTYFKQNQYGAVFPFYNNGHGDMMNEEMYAAIYVNTSMPPKMIDENNTRPCCATFFVDANLIHTRKKEEYVFLRERLRNYSIYKPVVGMGNPNMDCGRIMEYTWHILLTNRTTIPPLPEPLCRNVNL